MGKRSRTKGAAYELEVAAQINARWPHLEVKRRLGQERDGGGDLEVGPFLLECKRRKRLGTVEGWLRQAEEGAPDQPTLVVARADRGKSFAIIDLHLLFDLWEQYFQD